MSVLDRQEPPEEKPQRDEAAKQLVADMEQVSRDIWEQGYRDGLMNVRNSITEILGPASLHKVMTVEQVIGLVDAALSVRFNAAEVTS